jgi:inner membrane protease subunit 1
MSASQYPLERLLRFALRRSSRTSALRLTLDTAGAFCAAAWLWEHAFTVQLSEGPSMYPTFSVRGDYMLISRGARFGRGVQVGDVVRFYHPSFLGVHGAKRVLGLPGDFVCRDRALSKGVGGEMPGIGDGEGSSEDMEGDAIGDPRGREMVQVCLSSYLPTYLPRKW